MAATAPLLEDGDQELELVERKEDSRDTNEESREAPAFVAREIDDDRRASASDAFLDLPAHKKADYLSWTYKRTVHLPIFTVAVTVFEFIVLLLEFAENGGPDLTVWANVRPAVLVSLGAKYGPSIERGQWWRFIAPMFLHIGLLHYVLNASLQLLLGFQMEPMLGPWRMSLIYFVGGVGGNLLSAVFLPCIIEVGASSSIYGWISIYLADLLANWQYYKSPGKKCFWWCISTFVSLAAGLLPYMDNFAHIGGSISGLFVALLVTPRILPGQPIWFVRIIGGILLFTYFFTGFVFFYSGVEITDYCSWCDLLNCSEMFDACKKLYAVDNWASCDHR